MRSELVGTVSVKELISKELENLTSVVNAQVKMSTVITIEYVPTF